MIQPVQPAPASHDQMGHAINGLLELSMLVQQISCSSLRSTFDDAFGQATGPAKSDIGGGKTIHVKAK
jgi:hypothetical protein